MKKFISIVMTVSLVFSTMVCVFAEDIPIGEIEKYDLELKLSSDAKEIEIMKNFNGNMKFDYEQAGNVLKLKINEAKEDGERVYLTGNGQVILNSKTISFDFNKAELFKTESAGKVLYDGAMDIILSRENQKTEGILDLTMTKDYEEAVASLVVQNSAVESEFMLFYGEPFNAQKQLVQKTAEAYTQAVEAEEEKEDLNQVHTNIDQLSEDGGSKFHHVTNKSDKTLGGITREKQVIVMSVGKYDPRAKKEESGSELIRVFSRSYNAVNYVNGAIQAVPYRIKANFSCGKSTKNGPFVEITRTKPKDGSSKMVEILSILAPYVPSEPASSIITTALKFAASGFQSTLVKISDHMNTDAYTKATFNVLVWDSLNIDKNAVINLPKKTFSDDAEENAENGVAFVVDYDESSLAGQGSKATATCTANMEYRMIMDGVSRYSTVSTGTATITHTLYGRDYK